MSRNLDKHKKYKSAYKANDIFWGLGVEHETYLETSKLKQISGKELKENRARERYSVNYYSVYDTNFYNIAIDGLHNTDSKLLLPILLNSHSFQKTDINGEHQTTYERIPKPNKKFAGKTMFEWMKEQNPNYFNNEYEKSFLFDGDTVEFVTQNFYKASVDTVIKELISIQDNFIYSLNSLPKEGILGLYGPFQIAQQNYPFASYLTNLKNNAMFNNGTIHINLTLPTKLNGEGEVENFELFKMQHQNYARVLQWISPLLIANYGSPDPLSESRNNGEKYSAASQRVAVSRYIGLGTYDTDKMEAGKILTMKRSNLENIDWYYSFHGFDGEAGGSRAKDSKGNSGYEFLNDLGMDINFNKHYNHGIEFRILDSIGIKDLEEILRFVVYLADFSLDKTVENPKKSALWHKIAKECVHNGKGYYMDVPDQYDFLNIFNISCEFKEPVACINILNIIKEAVYNKYTNSLCVKSMITGRKDAYLKEEIKKDNMDTTKAAPIVNNPVKLCCIPF